ncbi:MAG: DUF2267 domain-containing protein [Dehalococcoidia bacterium]
MRYKEFIQQVNELAETGNEKKAKQVVEAVLQTLGERLSRTERRKLAAQLPGELKTHLHHLERTDLFSLEEFYNRVSARCDVTYAHAVNLSRAVMQILNRAVSAGELEDIVNELPSEFEELFGRQPESPTSPTALTTEEIRRIEKAE